jgi:UDP-galactopyranose mutase
MKKYDYLIFGSGLFGSVFDRIESREMKKIISIN